MPTEITPAATPPTGPARSPAAWLRAARSWAARSRAATLLLAGAALVGCATPTAGPEGLAAAAPGAGDPAGFAGALPYVRYRTDAVGLDAAVDDGRATYLIFAGPVPSSLRLFDQDGRALTAVVVGRVAAVDGLYAGVLVRVGEMAGYVAPDPAAVGRPAGPLVASGDLAAARQLLADGARLAPAMQRALRGAAPVPAPVAQAGLAPDIGSRAIPAGGEPSRLDGLDGSAGPLAVDRLAGPARAGPVQASPVQASPRGPAADGVVRIFFASASRMIVAPDDGLEQLLRHARLADEIRVSGFTDASGSRAVNEMLARARADAIVQILIRRGVAADRILSQGIAASAYLADNDTERGRALNRRAEVRLFRQGQPLLLP